MLVWVWTLKTLLPISVLRVAQKALGRPPKQVPSHPRKAFQKRQLKLMYFCFSNLFEDGALDGQPPEPRRNSKSQHKQTYFGDADVPPQKYKAWKIIALPQSTTTWIVRYMFECCLKPFIVFVCFVELIGNISELYGFPYSWVTDGLTYAQRRL